MWGVKRQANVEEYGKFQGFACMNMKVRVCLHGCTMAAKLGNGSKDEQGGQLNKLNIKGTYNLLWVCLFVYYNTLYKYISKTKVMHAPLPYNIEKDVLVLIMCIYIFK